MVLFNRASAPPNGGSNPVFKIGEVISIQDPYRMHRAQVRLFGVTDDTRGIPDSELPWYACAFPPSTPSLAGAHQSSALEAGSKVLVLLMDFPSSEIGFITHTWVPGPSSPSNIHPYAKAPIPNGPPLPIGDNGQSIDLGPMGDIGITDLLNNAKQVFDNLLKNNKIFSTIINLFKSL